MSNESSRKLRVAVMFGGKSAEHEVSIMSARNVVEALDPERFETVLIGIDKHGGWHTGARQALLDEAQEEVAEKRGAPSLSLIPRAGRTSLTNVVTGEALAEVDVVLPILHGPMGEDGTVQGMLELAGVPYVGPSVIAAAVGMDKDVMKRLLRDGGIPIGGFRTLRAHERAAFKADGVIAELGLPLFVKPANMGSSVGVSKAHDAAELQQAVDEAFSFDTKILIEAAIVGDEVECAVLGNDTPEVSVPGRIVPTHEFYDYEAKYLDEHGAALEIPAKLAPDVTARVQDLARATFVTLEGCGMGRVDMFVTSAGEVFVNEINTIPGFTSVSMYPKLWEATGLSYQELLSRLIDLAVERHQKRQNLKTTY